MDDIQYIVMGPNMWFKENIEKDAVLKALIYFSGRRNDIEFHSFKVSKGTYVNEMGGFVYPNDKPEPALQAKFKVPANMLEKIDDFYDWFLENFVDPDSKLMEIVNNED